MTGYNGSSYTWMGRSLTGATKDSQTLSFTYDANGIRTSKTVNGVKTEYLLNGTQILAQKTGSNTLCFFYDQQGNRVGMADSSNHFYYYLYNLQGDVIALADASTGKLAATYTYDAWGKIVKINGIDPDSVAESSIAKINPFRYRGYYYDTETGLYYLNSRYYDPEIGRFINADGIINNTGTITQNLFAYCGNNPVNHSDSTGQWFGLDDLIAGAVGTIVGVASQFLSDIVTSVCSNSWKFSSWQTYAGAAVGGAIGGITTLYAGAIAGASVGSGVSTLIGQTLENVTNGKKRSTKEIIINTLIDASIGGLVSKIVPIKISGITAGRNSMSAVFSAGLTKLGNKTASTISAKVIGKGLVSGFSASIGVASGIGFRNFITNTMECHSSPYCTVTTGLLYWCIP